MHTQSFSRARHPREILYLILSILATLTLLYFFYDFQPLWTVGIIIFALFYIRLLQGQYLGNALQVSSKHFFRLRQIIEEQARDLGVPEPKLFITQDPVPNAYTLGFKHPYSVILSSSLIESLDEDELESVIAHELGHVKFHHARISSIVSPAGSTLPIFSLLFGFWGRASEMTADNTALLVAENPRGLVTSLIKISVGPKFLPQIDEDELLNQSKEIKQSLFNRLGEWLNDHPYLTSRINNILTNAKDEGFPYQKSGKIHCIKCTKNIPLKAKFCPKCGTKQRID